MMAEQFLQMSSFPASPDAPVTFHLRRKWNQVKVDMLHVTAE